MEMPRQVRRRTPPPSSSEEEVLQGDLPAIASPISVSQSHEDGAGISKRDRALQQAAANAAEARKVRALDKNLSRSQADIDADKREQAIDALTVEFGCEYCQHAFQLGHADFDKLSPATILQDMRIWPRNLTRPASMVPERLSDSFGHG